MAQRGRPTGVRTEYDAFINDEHSRVFREATQDKGPRRRPADLDLSPTGCSSVGERRYGGRFQYCPGPSQCKCRGKVAAA